MMTMATLAMVCRFWTAAPIAAVKGPPAAEAAVFDRVAAVFNDFKWEAALVPTWTASSRSERVSSIYIRSFRCGAGGTFWTMDSL